VLVAAVLCAGCGDFARGSQSPSQLVVDGILVAPGTVLVPGAFGGTAIAPTFIAGPLDSDVPNFSNGEGAANDQARAQLRVILRDPGPSGAPTAPSSLNDVTITRYTVTYSRSGGPTGQNTPGVDVPHPIDGAVTFTIRAGQSATAVIDLVRIVAKLEAPLAVLGRSQEVLTMLAEVTFYGRDQAGNDVTATGLVQVNFANFN
jgi:hypothetical protein